MCLPVPRVPVMSVTVGGQQGSAQLLGRGRMWGLQPRAQGPCQDEHTPQPRQPWSKQLRPPRKHPHLSRESRKCWVALGGLWASRSLTCLSTCWTSSDLTG